MYCFGCSGFIVNFALLGYHLNRLYMEISKIIRKHGYDLATVAKEMGILRGSLANQICKGNPQVSYLRKIADIIGANINEFFEDEIVQHLPSSSSDFTALIKKGNNLYSASSIEELEALIPKLKE